MTNLKQICLFGIFQKKLIRFKNCRYTIHVAQASVNDIKNID